ncbi:ATP-binding protein [Catenuloplanes atrovinosus]|uniref:Sensor-like histidine kinase SenX3 n=1 Tax=Catenuloplanes atrovinosus TaxID=137266 RepID=A0AAE4C9F5_9ACTN|nr:ATP-binding protein [Catenuloplanes atrovinosus]MDR7275757.1 signal transduction histidine kinase [Catenuloplanes atrovinosus]
MDERKRFPAWRPAAILAAVVGVFGVSVAVGVAGVVAAEQRQTAQEQLQRRSSVVTARVAAEARRYTDSVSLAAAALGWREEVTAESFAEVTEPVVRMRLPGASSVVFLAAADSGTVAQTQRRWRSLGAADLVLRPVGGGGEHIFSIFSVPLDGAAAPAGIDATQAPAPTYALRESRAGHRVVVSDAYHLLRDRTVPAAARQLSFVITAPVLAPADAAGRRAFRGWVLMGLRGQDFIGDALRESSQDLIDVTLRAHTATGTADIATLRAAAGGRRDLAWQANVRVANRSWMLAYAAAGPSLPGGSTGLPTSLAAGGTVTSLLLAGLVWVLATGRVRAQAQVTAATARLRTTADELAGQKDYLAQVLDAVHVTILTCDTEGRLVHTNTEGRTRIGDAGARRHVADLAADLTLVYPDGSPYPMDRSPLLRALNGEDVRGEEVVRILPDGSRRYLITHSRALRTPAGEPAGAVSSSYDVTALREREAELTAFAGVVAHDLKNPLTSLTGYAEIVQEDLAELPDMHRQAGMLDRMLNTGARMRRLIDDLLELAAARDGAVRPDDVDLRELVEDVVEERLVTAGAPMPRIHVAALDRVHADPAMVLQLVDNLIGNAVTYTPPGESAHLEVTSADTGDGWVRVEVADRGIGIPAGQHQAVFNDFHRAHPAAGYSGTGLGLAICRRIVTRHGGTIGVEDNPGGGARFWFTLPSSAG